MVPGCTVVSGPGVAGPKSRRSGCEPHRPKTLKNHVHLYLASSAQERDQETERFLALGACGRRLW
jgi:hypothetical protein